MRRLALAVLLVSSGAAADAPDSRVTSVRAELSGSVATLRVSYAYVIEEAGYGNFVDMLDLPATALVTAATVRRDGITRRLDLLRAEEATRKWEALGADDEELTAEPPGARRSAVRIAGSSGSVEVSIASPRRGRVDIEVELAMPTCYFRDARHLVIPAAWTPHLRGTLRTTAKPASELSDACQGTGEGTWISFAVPEIARRRSGDRLGAFAGRLVAGEDHLVRVEVDLASMLADTPRDLATVLVVDASRSMTVAQRETQRELVLAYLRAAKDTRVQVIAYARTAGALLPSWSIASRALARVDRELRALPPRNGSNLDVGLEQAGRWLAQIEGTHRVVLVTDELMSSRVSGIQPATLKRVLPPGTLVHVVSTVGGGDGLIRDDSVELAALAAATDGIGARADKAPIDATMLIRPISIDQLVVTAPGWSQFVGPSGATCGADDRVDLAEGSSCTWWGHGDVTSGPIAVAGLVWGTRVTRVLRPDPTHGLEVARELSVAQSIDPALLERLELMARGVNPQWSLYVEWGGTGRYFEGFGFGRIGTGCCGGGSFSSHPSIGIGTIGRAHREPDDLTAQLAPAVARCQLERETARVTLEMTVLEIVDVTVMISADAPIPPNRLRKLTACVEDAIWDASPMIRNPLSHSHHSVTFKAS